MIWWTNDGQDGSVGASAKVISSESPLDVSKQHLHAFPEPQGLEPPSHRSLALIRRQLPAGTFRDKFMILDDLAQERILKRIWYSPAITNNLDSIRISPMGEIHYVCSEFCGLKSPIIADNVENVIVKDKSIINSAKCKKAILLASKLIKNQGRMLVRKSGTEPKIRIMGESDNKILLSKCINIVKNSIK